MMKAMKNYKVTILSDQYSLVSDEPEEYVFELASTVDTIMKEIAAKTKTHDSKKIAVLAALRLASSLKKLESDVAQENITIKQYVNRIDDSLKTL